jgi:hypothetical protein
VHSVSVGQLQEKISCEVVVLAEGRRRLRRV